MENDNHEEIQNAYWVKDIAQLLDISTSNLRRWSIDLENATNLLKHLIEVSLQLTF